MEVIALVIFLGEMGLRRMLANRQQGRNLSKAWFWECTGLISIGNKETGGESCLKARQGWIRNRW